MVKRGLLIGAAATFAVVVGLIVTAPSEVGYRHVLGVELPEGVECVGELYNQTGIDRTWYDYHGAFQGGHTCLLSYLTALRLEEKDRTNFNGTINMGWVTSYAWWAPPSTAGCGEYTFFEKKIGFSGDNRPFIKAQAELVGDRLFIVQFGDIKSLKRKQLKGGGKGVAHPRAGVKR
jgi:hypothetical protein